jgi:murein L,D-transpeptidase YafK
LPEAPPSPARRCARSRATQCAPNFSLLLLFLLFSLALLVPTPALAARIREPAAILQRAESVLAEDLTAWSAAAGLVWPPERVVIRIFKQERELEIWAGAGDGSPLRLVRTLPVCAMDFLPGPKLAQGDGRTPEGFYHPEFGYDSQCWWMWMDLDAVDATGEVGRGSCFKMCIEYPNALDRKRSRALGIQDPGGAICIHGNCVSIGCASLSNRDFLAVFTFARHHLAARHGPLQVHLFPFRFDQVGPEQLDALLRANPPTSTLGERELRLFWDNLKEGFERFNLDPRPLSVRVGENRYLFD